MERADVALGMRRAPVLLQMGTMSRVVGRRLRVRPPAFLGFHVPGAGASVSVLPFWQGLQNGNQMNLERTLEVSMTSLCMLCSSEGDYGSSVQLRSGESRGSALAL